MWRSNSSKVEMTRHSIDTRLTALGEPNRRAIVDLLSAGPLSVGELSSRLPISRPAVSQHLRVLFEAGLINYEQSGTRNYYELDPDAVAEVKAYLDGVWTKALKKFKSRAESKKG
jgi:DNA-binding transcriptional ArsR family regulator